MDVNFGIQDILESVNKREFELRFQPQIALETPKLVAMSCSLVWNKRGYEALNKASVLHILDQHNKRVSFFLYYLLQALQARRQLEASGHCIQIGISLRPGELACESFYREVTQVFNDSGVSPKGVCLQLPGSIAEDIGRYRGALTRLHDFGFSLTLSGLERDPATLPPWCAALISEVISPASLGRELASNRHAEEALNQLLAGSNALGWRCVIDGIDSPAALEAAQIQGVQFVQGQFFGHDLHLDTAQNLLNADLHSE